MKIIMNTISIINKRGINPIKMNIILVNIIVRINNDDTNPNKMNITLSINNVIIRRAISCIVSVYLKKPIWTK